MDRKAEWPLRGQRKLEFGRRLSDSWREVAEASGVPVFDRERFAAGHEGFDLWDWLEVRDLLPRLPTALAQANRDDLLALFDDEPTPQRAGPSLRQVGAVPNAADCYQHRPAAAQVQRALLAETANRQLMTGLGGVGKTQLAAAVVRGLVAAGVVEDTVWVTATSADAIRSSLALAAAELAGVDRDDHAQAVTQFQAWLATTRRTWLIVFDDLADPRDLDGLWPPVTATGRVLVTTRRRDAALAGHGRLVEVGPFEPAEAHAYLVQRFVDAPLRLTEAAELAADLGHLPVALAQAATYIADRDLSCSEYRRRFAGHALSQLAPDSWPDEYPRSVAVTLSLNIDAADALAPPGLARPLLTLLSLLAPHGIPGEIINAGPVLSYLTDRAGHPVDSDQAADALTCLTRLNLADTSAPGRGQVQVHALVQRASREQTAPELDAVSAAADALLSLWPEVEYDTEFAQRLRAHAVALRGHAEHHLWTHGRYGLLYRLGRSYGESGQVAAAIRHFAALLTQATIRLGAGHPDTLAARLELARWRGEAGDAAAAVTALLALHADQVRALGADHVDTLTTRLELARWRGEAGDPAAAVIALEELFVRQRDILGPDHVDTLRTRLQLAHWMGKSGRLQAAVRACEQLLPDRERIVGPDHPNTLETLSNLARWRGQAGDPAGAAAAMEQVLAGRTRVLGPDHPRTLTARHQLARWRGHSGDPVGAWQALEALLADQLRVLGPDHPHTLATRHQIAGWRRQAGDREGSVASLEALVADQLRVLGHDHPRTLTALADLKYWVGRG